MKQTTGVYAVLTAALFLGSMAGVGCGDDETTTTGTAGSGGSGGSTGGTAGKAGSGGSGGATGGTGGTGGTAGMAGSGGTAGKAGSAGSDAGSDAPTSITCGTRTCNPVSGGVAGTLAPCCPMGEMNACGGIVTQAGGACITTTLGTPDMSCPSVMAQIPLAGCCRPNGFCGLNFSLVMLGCADPTPLGGMGNIPCGGDAAPPTDGSPPADTGGGDTGTGDTGGGDTGTGDTGGGDTGTGDTGTGDTGTGDGRGDTGDSAPPSDAPLG